jgi:hypothetical protein
MLGDLLGKAPDRINQQLFDAFDIQALYSKTKNQVTLWATITPSTPAALAAIIAASGTPDLAALLTGQDHPSDWHHNLEQPISRYHHAGPGPGKR